MKNQKGQTLIALLFFVMIGIIATAAISIIIFTNLLSNQKVEDAETLRQLAETGGESALIMLLRDSNYLGETLNIDGAEIVVSVTGGAVKTIESTATVGEMSRQIEITANIVNNVLTVTSWRAVF